MKTKTLLLIILITTLVSCAPSSTIIATETAMLFPSSTPVPTSVSATPEIKGTSASSNTPPSLCVKSVLVSSNQKQLTSDVFHVSLQYPANWECDKTGNAAFLYSGTDGFFQLMAEPMMASTAKEVCETQAQHSIGKGQNRYGASPSIEILQVDNQPACLVLPSEDQPKDQRGLSLLVVEYPKSSTEHTRLLLLSADKNHIRDLMSTLKFVH